MECAINAYIAADEANNIIVKKGTRNYEKNVKDRLALEQLSIRYCSRLKSYITIAKRLFKLRNRKVKAWVALTVQARSYLKKWYDAEVERFK